MKNLNNDQKNQLRCVEKRLGQIKGFMGGLLTSADHLESYNVNHIMDMANKIVGMVDEADEIIDTMMDDV